MKTVIITGAAGFIGSALTQYCLDNNQRVIAITHKTPLNIKHPNLLTVNDIDLNTDGIMLFNILSRLKKEYKLNFDTFYHLAWNGVYGDKRFDWSLQLTNVEVCKYYMTLASNLGCRVFLTTGSLMEYEAAELIHNTNIVKHSAYKYGFAKLYSHFSCRDLADKLGITYVHPIVSNAYGVGELSGRFINATINRILNKEPLNFTLGTQWYDFVYISDVVEALNLISTYGTTNTEYMIGSGESRPLKEFIQVMIQIIDASQVPNFGAYKAEGISLRKEVFDISKLTNMGFVPKVSFKEGVNLTAHWLKEGNNNNEKI